MRSRILIYTFIIASCFIGCKRNNNADNEKKINIQFGDNHDMIKKPITEIQQMLRENKAKIQNGDLIMRSDDGLESESLRSFSKTDDSFSHCGLAFLEDGDIYVYHNMAGKENVTEQLMRQPFDSFVNINQKTGFGLFRYNLTPDEIQRLQAISKDNFAKGLKFDKNFDLKTDDKMYCAEMIYKFIKQATNNRVILPTTTIQNFRVKDPRYKGLVLKEFEYVALDNLFINPYCTELGRIAYYVPKDK